MGCTPNICLGNKHTYGPWYFRTNARRTLLRRTNARRVCITAVLERVTQRSALTSHTPKMLAPAQQHTPDQPHIVIVCAEGGTQHRLTIGDEDRSVRPRTHLPADFDRRSCRSHATLKQFLEMETGIALENQIILYGPPFGPLDPRRPLLAYSTSSVSARNNPPHCAHQAPPPS